MMIKEYIKDIVKNIFELVDKTEYDTLKTTTSTNETKLKNEIEDFKTELERCERSSKQDIKNFQYEIKRFEDKIKELEFYSNEQEKKVERLLKELEGTVQLPDETIKFIKYYEEKYPERTVYYAGYTVNFKGKNQRLTMRVFDLVTKCQSMKDWLVDNDLMYKGDYTIVDMSKHCWKLVDFYCKTKMFYITDENLFGVIEQWLPNNVQWYIRKGNKLKGDCENHATAALALIELSGIPEGFARDYCGNTNNNFGHCSLACWDWRTEKYEQWETTATEATVIDKEHFIYIKDVDYSFTSARSWTTKPTDTYKVLSEITN